MENKPSFKSIITSFVFILFLGGLSFFNLLSPSPETLLSERRKPADMPKLTVSTLLSTEFMSGFNSFATDTFLCRDTFRTIRSVCTFYIFNQTDKDGYYLDSKVGAGKFGRNDEDALVEMSRKLNILKDLFPNDVKLYYTVIPDKSMYAGRQYPGFDPNQAELLLSKEMKDMTYIDLVDALSNTGFYKTDIHWNQSGLVNRGGVLEILSKNMNFEFEQFIFNEVGKFNGVSTGQIALPQKPDRMIYLTSSSIEAATVKFIDTKTLEWYEGQMYDVDAFFGRDPYDIFLCGSQPLITIENPLATEKRELYIFRDSYSSSLAPLLVSAYSKITVIDMRYIDSRLLKNLIPFNESSGADVLFIYGSQLWNSPEVLQVN